MELKREGLIYKDDVFICYANNNVVNNTSGKSCNHNFHTVLNFSKVQVVFLYLNF